RRGRSSEPRLQLAEAVVGEALSHQTRRLRRRFSDLPGGALPFCVLALGKLGGEELNYSSDIDLLFLYDDRGKAPEAGQLTDRASLFEHLGRWLLVVLGTSTVSGQLYRVDMRLRPEGDRGPLATGLRAALRYYEERGRTWERQALLKARPLAGDLDLGRELLRSLEPIMFRRFLSGDAIAEVKALKRRLESRARQRPFFDLKSGEGGIRDIEFTVQFLQLLHGGELPEVHATATLAAIAGLAATGCLDPPDGERLSQAYVFLRTVEHRIQAFTMRQTHALPDDPDERGDVACRMGYGGAAAREEFQADLDGHLLRVREALNRLFHHVFPEVEEEEAREALELLLDPSPPHQEIERVLSRFGFHDWRAAYRDLQRLATERSRYRPQAPRTRTALASLAPRLLRVLARQPDPQATLSRLERTAATLGAKAVFYDLLAAEPDALELFCRLASESVFLSEVLIRNPGLLDEVIDLLLTGTPISVESVLSRASRLGGGKLAGLCQAHREILLLVGLRDLGGKANLQNVQEELSALAEACLRMLVDLALQESTARFGDPPEDAGFILLGLGHLGGGELDYGSDLDLVAAYEGEGRTTTGATLGELYARAAQRLQELSEQTKLYAIDQRLRPGGRSAPLLVRADRLEAYYAGGQAEVWERLAATKLRAVAGDLARGEKLVERVLSAIYSRCPEGLSDRTLEMREKLEAAQRSPEDLKRGPGGLLDLEFLSAYLKLRHRGEPRAIRSPGIVGSLRALAEAGWLAADAYSDLLTGYQLLRKIESHLRLGSGRPVASLPTRPEELGRLARGLGYVDTRRRRAGAALLSELEHERRVIRRRFLEVLGD
ncbi:hypothetical protein ACFL59_15470, partial [Planctomycetota bacterium]